MELDRKTVDKVTKLKRTFDIITDKRVCIDSDSVSHDVKVKADIIPHKDMDGILIITSNITVFYNNSRVGDSYRVNFNTKRGSFLIYFSNPVSWSAEVGIYHDKEVVINHMNNSLTGKEFEDLNRSIVDLMLSYKED